MSRKQQKTVSISDLTKGKRLTGVVLRRRLRNEGIRKPGKHWVWPVSHRDLKKVKQLAK